MNTVTTKIELIRPDWPAPDSVAACATTRAGGVSSGPWAGLNLATHVDDAPADVDENRARLTRALDLPGEPRWLEQVHGTRILLPGDTDSCADACFDERRGVVCVVMTADCLPVLFCNRDGTRVAAAHAGWRGLLNGVLEQTAAVFRDEPGRLLAWLGPAIGPRAFEVGDEVRSAFVEQHPAAADCFAPTRAGHWMADLYALARQRLTWVGIESVYGGGHCTFSESERFYSYRRDGVTGRMASLIWLKS